MVLYGILVLNPGGLTIYSKIIDLEFEPDPLLIGNFLTAIQSFSKEIDKGEESGIQELIMHNLRIKYRQFNILTFIGLTKPTEDSKAAELILEYMISAFLSKFKRYLYKKSPISPLKFLEFDNIFAKYRNSNEKELKAWLETKPSSFLQGMINLLVNYFPVNDLITLNKSKLIIIGKRLIWVSFDIDKETEIQIFNRLKTKTIEIYGKNVFDSILNQVKQNLPKNIRI